MRLLLKERICSKREQILYFKGSPPTEREKNISMSELFALDVSISLKAHTKPKNLLGYNKSPYVQIFADLKGGLIFPFIK